MISIYDVLEWLCASNEYGNTFEHSYCGKLDNKKEKSLGFYPLKGSGKPYRAFEGLESYDKCGVSLLIHYNKNVVETQNAANIIFNYLRTLYTNALPKVKGCDVLYIDLLVPEPVFVGTDDNGVYEFVIEFELYTEKEIDG